MKVILLEPMENLGEVGAVVNVKPGYARNYLLPRGLAVLATAGATKALAQEKQAQDRKKARELTSAQALAARLTATELRIQAKVGDGGRLFGSVTAADIAESLAAHGIVLDKRRIELKEPIKAAGRFTVEVKVYQEISARLTLDVVAE